MDKNTIITVLVVVAVLLVWDKFKSKTTSTTSINTGGGKTIEERIAKMLEEETL